MGGGLVRSVLDFRHVVDQKAPREVLCSSHWCPLDARAFAKTFVKTTCARLYVRAELEQSSKKAPQALTKAT